MCRTIPAGWNLNLNRCTCNDKTLSANWQIGDTMYVPIELYRLSCKISLLSRQRTIKALIRLRGCAGWSAPLLFTYDKNRFSHDVAQINRSYLFRIRWKTVCCVQFYGEKKNCWFTIVEVIFAEDLLEINLLWLRLHVWGTVSCDCLCSGQKVF